MSLLGIDIGTSGCKSLIFSLTGQVLAKAYREYEIISEKEGHAELDSFDVWRKVKETIKEAVSQVCDDPVTALSVSSLGEAVVPVARDRTILGNSILGIDQRGGEYFEELLKSVSKEDIYRINGNIPGVFYSMPKIAWLKQHMPDVYLKTDYFLLWADAICFMLGGKPVSTYSLASRTLLFDINRCCWSVKLMHTMDLNTDKFAPLVPSGIILGTIDEETGRELHLTPDVVIISGGHDQCCAALGSGIIGDHKQAMYGMGTFICAVPTFSRKPDYAFLFKNKLNIEHHVVANLFVSFIYNLSGGALVKWFRKTFTGFDEEGLNDSQDIYDKLFNLVPDSINNIIVIPRFGPTGPPDFFQESAGTISGLSLHHGKGDILRAILEGITFYFKDFFQRLKESQYDIEILVANGGGASSDKWLQITADILEKPLITNTVTESGALGAALLAGIGSGTFPSVESGITSMVQKEKEIYPRQVNTRIYNRKFERYKKIYAFLRE